MSRAAATTAALARAPLPVATCATRAAALGAWVETHRCTLCGGADVRLESVPLPPEDLTAAGFTLQPLGPGRLAWIWRHECRR